MSEDPMEAIRRLRDRLAETAAKLGLEMLAFTVMASDENHPDMAQVAFAIGELPADDQADVDAAFAEIARAERVAAADQLKAETAERARRLAKELTDED